MILKIHIQYTSLKLEQKFQKHRVEETSHHLYEINIFIIFCMTPWSQYYSTHTHTCYYQSTLPTQMSSHVIDEDKDNISNNDGHGHNIKKKKKSSIITCERPTQQ